MIRIHKAFYNRWTGEQEWIEVDVSEEDTLDEVANKLMQEANKREFEEAKESARCMLAPSIYIPAKE